MDSAFVARMEFCASVLGSVAALARTAGISQSGIRKYYLGAEPTRPVLIALARATGISLLWLVDGRGSVADNSSPLVIAAKRELMKNFAFALRTTEFLNLPTKDAAVCYTDEYNEGATIGELRDWVRAVIPKLDWRDILDWHKGNLAAAPRCFATENSTKPGIETDWIQGSADVVVSVARELPIALGTAYQDLSKDREAGILRELVDFLMQLDAEARETLLRPEGLRAQIQFVARFLAINTAENPVETKPSS